MRNQFNNQLEQLHVELIQMGALCEEAIADAMKALLDGDKDALSAVFSTDREIDQKEKTIESRCLKLLLQQQPVAGDLRTISSALKMISDMERIGDQASDIAEITKFIQTSGTQYAVQIPDMAQAAIQMVTDSVESFVKQDLGLVQKVISYDDVLDDLFTQVRQGLINLIVEDHANGELCLDLLMIAKYLERIGDHAVNIAEWVEYSITGVHKQDKEW